MGCQCLKSRREGRVSYDREGAGKVTYSCCCCLQEVGVGF